jgi:hypothetical protein
MQEGFDGDVLGESCIMNRGSVRGIVSSLTEPEFLYENAL